MREKVEEAINKIRPMLQADGACRRTGRCCHRPITGSLRGLSHVANDFEKRDRKNTEKGNSGSRFGRIGTLISFLRKCHFRIIFFCAFFELYSHL